jgi:predicted RNase H-like nuclease
LPYTRLKRNVRQLNGLPAIPIFIGVDLAWRSDRNHTGAAVISGDRTGARLVAVADPIHTLEGVRRFVDDHAEPATVIAIDAPLIIPNPTGQRLGETAVGKRYGGQDASCHTSNQRLYPSAPSVVLAATFVAQGYAHAPEARDSSLVLLEVYPHAAMVALFDLPKVLKYKKGPLAQKRQGLRALAAHLRRLSAARPELDANDRLEAILSREIARLPRADLKMYEDALDAVFCAYLAYYFWYWGMERNEVFGSVEMGYILNPTLLVGGIEKHAT